MLKEIKLRNFRTHKRTRLKMCSGINGIIGISSSGKTNIIRALRLLNYNRPLGNGIISRFAKGKNAIIETIWTDIGKVQLVKGAKSYYKINNQKPFRKFGTSVPEAVTNSLFLSDINFHNQFDGPYLLFSGPGEISKVINSATGADEFDIWISNVNSRIKHLRYDLKDSMFRIEKYRKEIGKLKSLKGVHYAITRLKETTDKSKELQEKFDELSEFHNSIIGLNHKIVRHRKIARLQRKIDSIYKIQSEMEILEEKADLIEDYQTKLNLTKAAKERHEELSKEYITILREIKQCPTCASPIKKSTIERLKNAIRLPV